MPNGELTYRRGEIRWSLLTQHLSLKRVARIELATKAWEAFILPLNYTRNRHLRFLE
jgi:hypothetical protein